MPNDGEGARIRTLRAPPAAEAELEAVDPREFALEEGRGAAPGLPDWTRLHEALRAVEQEASACRARAEAEAREAREEAARLAAELEAAREQLHDAERRVEESEALRRRLREALGA